jgi:hypothetical protein
MIVKIEFKDEEMDELQTALDGSKWKMVVWDVNQKLRKYLKWDDSLTDDQCEMVEKIKKDLHELLNDYNLNLD